MIPAYRLSEITVMRGMKMKGLLEREIATEREIIPDEHSICVTCIHSGHCMYQGRSTKPIDSCDEFESETANLEQPEILLKRQLAETEGLFKGLCANCNYRNTCMFADSVSGVWHCEEYK